jgi:uncharacterized membrane protein
MVGYVTPMTRPRSNPLAVASLILSILMLGGVGSIAGMILGFVARDQIRRSGGRQTGDGLALAGIVTGIVGIVLMVLLILWLVVLTNTVSHLCNLNTHCNFRG